MQTKPTLRVLGTLLFLYGAFGYIFPQWGQTVFTNNENLFHVLTGLGAILYSHSSVKRARNTLFILALAYLALGIYGFTLRQPTDFKIKRITAQLDETDNYTHAVIGVAFAWFWLKAKKV